MDTASSGKGSQLASWLVGRLVERTLVCTRDTNTTTTPHTRIALLIGAGRVNLAARYDKADDTNTWVFPANESNKRFHASIG